MTNTRPKGLLNIPQQLKPTAESFDTRPKHVETWLTSLPMADTGECARHIYHTLREINRLSMRKGDRFNILDAISEPVLNINQVLKRHYINQNLPLSPKNKRIAELAIELNQEVATGYAIIIEEIWTGNLTYFNKKDALKAIHHAIYFLSNALVTTYQIYADPPDNAWIQVHQLYLYAEENRFADQPLRDKSKHLTLLPGCSISDLYKQILLLALISPYRLRQDIIERVYNLLSGWSGDCQIRLPGHTAEDEQSVVIRLTSNVSPGFYSTNESVDKINTRVIDASALVHRIGDYMLSAHNTRSTGTRIELPDSVLKLLTITWGGRSKRIFTRKPAQNNVSITIGLSATHHLITELLRLNPGLEKTGPCANTSETVLGMDISQTNVEEEEEPAMDVRANFDNTTPTFGISSLDNHTSDIWDSDYSSKSIGYEYNLKMLKNSLEGEPDDLPGTYAPHTGSNINESAGGHCLLGTIDYSADAPKVQIGELIGIYNTSSQDSGQVSIGVIRRIRNTDSGIELGIQKLAPCAHTISSSKQIVSKSSQQFIRSLVLPEIKSLQQPFTLVTHDMHKVNDVLIVYKQGHRFRIRLTRLVESTGVFSRFEFTVLNMMSANKTQESRETTDSYDGVWSLI